MPNRASMPRSPGMTFDLAVIDLDNTLYAATNGVFARMDERMTTYVARELGVDRSTADQLRVEYWQRYGTTLRGMMLHHGMAPEPFLAYVHDIGVEEMLEKDAALANALARLPGRKVIHTNGTCEHAGRVLQALGVDTQFDAIYDIRFNEYVPKPCRKTLHMLLEQECTPPSRALVIDDMEDNLATARELGTGTALVSEKSATGAWDYHIPSARHLATIT